MQRTTNEHVLPLLKQAFVDGGVRAAVIFLNSLTPHRFTSLYRFDGEMLRNINFYDREQPDQLTSDDIPVLASYCVFVRETNQKFMVSNAMADDRVHNHPKQCTIQSYCGVPLLDHEGNIFGTICHFDFKPGGIADLDVELLEFMATLLPDQSGHY